LARVEASFALLGAGFPNVEAGFWETVRNAQRVLEQTCLSLLSVFLCVLLGLWVILDITHFFILFFNL